MQHNEKNTFDDTSYGFSHPYIQTFNYFYTNSPLAYALEID